jgi:REP element-mobilizing transposase RayT
MNAFVLKHEILIPMSDKFKGKYRSESARLQNWDYRWAGAYFITICTKNREHLFGEIEDGKMHVSPAGAIAFVLWHEIKNHVNNIELGEFVVMPNHVHGILILNGENHQFDNHGRIGGKGDANNAGRDVACNVPTETKMKTEYNPIDPLENQWMSAISPKSNTVSTIIRSYKSAVTKYCNRLELPMAWQPRFYDHIIRNDESFHRISKYIANNPKNW